MSNENRVRLQAILDDLQTATVPIDMPTIERALVAILRTLLDEQRDSVS
jgi:hypothetical protein